LILDPSLLVPRTIQQRSTVENIIGAKTNPTRQYSKKQTIHSEIRFILNT